MTHLRPCSESKVLHLTCTHSPHTPSPNAIINLADSHENESGASNVEIRHSQTWLMGFGRTQCVQNINTAMGNGVYLGQLYLHTHTYWLLMDNSRSGFTQLQKAVITYQCYDLWEHVQKLSYLLMLGHWSLVTELQKLSVEPSVCLSSRVLYGLQHYLCICVHACFNQGQESLDCNNKAMHNTLCFRQCSFLLVRLKCICICPLPSNRYLVPSCTDISF